MKIVFVLALLRVGIKMKFFKGETMATRILHIIVFV